MLIGCSLGEARRLFLEHLREAGVQQHAIALSARILHGPFKRMILSQLPQARRVLPVESLLISRILHPRCLST